MIVFKRALFKAKIIHVFQLLIYSFPCSASHVIPIRPTAALRCGSATAPTTTTAGLLLWRSGAHHHCAVDFRCVIVVWRQRRRLHFRRRSTATAATGQRLLVRFDDELTGEWHPLQGLVDARRQRRCCWRRHKVNAGKMHSSSLLSNFC